MQEIVPSPSPQCDFVQRERDFDNPSDKNVDPPFSLQSVILKFAETELLNPGFHDLLLRRVWLTKSILLLK